MCAKLYDATDNIWWLIEGDLAHYPSSVICMHYACALDATVDDIPGGCGFMRYP